MEMAEKHPKIALFFSNNFKYLEYYNKFTQNPPTFFHLENKSFFTDYLKKKITVGSFNLVDY